MNHKFTPPEMEIIYFNDVDIITTSGGDIEIENEEE